MALCHSGSGAGSSIYRPLAINKPYQYDKSICLLQISHSDIYLLREQSFRTILIVTMGSLELKA